MATRTNPLAGRYFNDPYVARAFSSLAGAFAPPSPSDYLTAEQVFGKRFENQSIQDAWAAMTDPDATPGVQDRYGIAATLFGKGFNPTQSNRAVDIASADRRYNTDVTADTNLAMNAADNERALREAIIGGTYDAATTPLTYGEALPGLDPSAAAALGATAGVPVPAIPSRTGAALGAQPDPLSSDEVTAAVMQDLIEQNPELAQRFAFADLPTVNTVGGDGTPQVSFAGDAAAQGAEPYINKGAQAAPDLLGYALPDGTQGTAIFDPNTQTLVDAATKKPLPPGARTFKIVGDDRNAAAGLTTANQTRMQQTLYESDYGLGRVQAFRQLLQENPGIMGIPGQVRGLAQDIGAAATEFGEAFGPIESVEEAQRLAAEIAGRNGYDPAYAQAAAYALEMAYLDAKMQDPSGEVNVRELERQLRIYDGGIAGNPKVLAALENLEDRLTARRNSAVTAMGDGTPGAAPAPAPAGAAGQRPRAVNDAGDVIEWNGQDWVPVQ